MVRICESEICVSEYSGAHLVLDETIWDKAKEYFKNHRKEETVLVFDKRNKVIGYAWQDREANREVRMLKELRECPDAVNFRDLHSDCIGVTIHGCNELAWLMAEYLRGLGLVVNGEGKLWKELGAGKKHDIPIHQNYEIWAEGVHQKSEEWKKERLRSASVEFECVDEIYEANIKDGKIADAAGDCDELLKMLYKEKEIVIRGTGTMAQDTYDWLLANGIRICAFQSDRSQNGRRTLFNISILGRAAVEEQFKRAVIIECASKHSAWGFGDVDGYDYNGYERNKRYLLLRDYIEVPKKNLVHVIAKKNLILIGDECYCNRARRWFEQCGSSLGEIEYWNILKDDRKFCEKNIYLLIQPTYGNTAIMTEDAKNKYNVYLNKLQEYDISDFTDYFSDSIKFIYLETEEKKYTKKELQPAGILLGAIPAFSGNILVTHSLAGHPQIMLVEGGKFWNRGSFLVSSLYSICICLAEEKTCNILNAFWEMYLNEAGAEGIERDFPYKEKFNHKMEELLSLDDHFTSQELFVMFHIANEAMYDREILDVGKMIIVWQPHGIDHNCIKEFAWWLCSDEVKGFTLGTVRNRYIRAGSSMKLKISQGYGWEILNGCMFGNIFMKKRMFPNWEECIVRFEDLKCKPEETLNMLCEWLGISFNESLLETTFRGTKTFYGDITGFDVRPAYNLYEEYFSPFDRMRISIAAGSYQRQYSYPFVSCQAFTRRELQEMFLKEFHWEQLFGEAEKENMELVWYRQCTVRYLLWMERFAEIMGKELDEQY